MEFDRFDWICRSHLFQLYVLVGGKDEACVAEEGGGEAEMQSDLHIPRLQCLAGHLHALKASPVHRNLFRARRCCQHVPYGAMERLIRELHQLTWE